MKYYAIKPMTAAMVPAKGLLDFFDFGTPVHCRGCEEPVWGWVETEKPIAPGLPSYLGLIPAKG